MVKNRAYKSLESIGWGSYNNKVFFQCGLAWMSFEVWFVNIAYILQGAKLEWHLSTFPLGILGTCFQFGLLIGNILWGYIADTYGRIRAFKVTIITTAFSAFLLVFAVSYYMVGVALFTLGTSLSGEMALGGTVFYEFCPPSKRSKLTLMSIFLSIGSTMIALVAYLVSLLNNSSIRDWRWIVGFGCCVEIFSLFFRFFMRETPPYLIRVGKLKEAEEVLTKISMKNRGIAFKLDDLASELNENVKFPIVAAEGMQNMSTGSVAEEETAKVTKAKILQIVSEKYLKTTLVICFIFVINHYSYAGFLYFMPEFLHQFSTSTAYLIILIQQISGIPGSLIGSWAVETRLGRRYTICISFVITGICSVAFYYSNSLALIIVFSGLIFCFIYSGIGGVFTILPESYPTSTRSTGSAVGYIASRVGGILTPVFTGLILEYNHGFEIALGIYAVFLAGSGLLALLLEETRIVKVTDGTRLLE